MKDSSLKREARKRVPLPPGHNRKDRRRLAKKYGLFKGPGRLNWQRGNAHMKERLGEAVIKATKKKGLQKTANDIK